LQGNALFGGKDGGGLGNMMENLKKAQTMVQGEAAKIQQELAACAPLQGAANLCRATTLVYLLLVAWLANAGTSPNSGPSTAQLLLQQ
jgi:hypothetical protein